MDKKPARQFFVERLSDLMKDKGLTAWSLAPLINIPYATIHNWYTRIQNPNLEYLTMIARFFNVTTDYLLGLEDEFGNKT